MSNGFSPACGLMNRLTAMRLAWPSMLWLVVFAAVPALEALSQQALGQQALGQQPFGQPAMSDGVSDMGAGDALADRPAEPEMSRQDWQERIQQAKRRARDVALDRRLNPSAYAPPPPEDPAKIATERVMRDDSLQPGDIVATNKGLFIFRGRPDQPRGEGDFVALPAR